MGRHRSPCARGGWRCHALVFEAASGLGHAAISVFTMDKFELLK
jgi:hypothetical protein